VNQISKVIRQDVLMLIGVLLVATAPAESESLSSKQASIVTIAAFTANGDLVKLNAALHEGLDSGLTINEIKEVLVQMYAYAGFPRSLNAINTFIEVLKHRKEQGKKDSIGAEPSPLPTNKTSLELGTEIRARLTGSSALAGYARFTPVIDEFLRSHLFGDIFGRDNLDFQSREIATIGALATLKGVNPQLQSHFRVGLNVGLSDVQLRSIVSVIAARVDKKQASDASQVLDETLRSPPAQQRSYSKANEVARPSQPIRITRSGEVASRPAAADHFAGSAQVQLLVEPTEPARASVASVTFEAGAHTAWHMHPLGQILIVTAGVGYAQQWGGLRQEIRPGDVVRIPPGTKHWHGASHDMSMSHVAVSEALDGKTVEWMEAVSNEQYGLK
jgi:quercetin dioxygenase-like cupin family protein/alkylhydroperoxidase/carboxymuconolactone decarboxylase family protein YurZ